MRRSGKGEGAPAILYGPGSELHKREGPGEESAKTIEGTKGGEGGGCTRYSSRAVQSIFVTLSVLLSYAFDHAHGCALSLFCTARLLLILP